MTWTRSSCFCPKYALVLLCLGVSRTGAWGALAAADNLETAAAVAGLLKMKPGRSRSKRAAPRRGGPTSRFNLVQPNTFLRSRERSAARHALGGGCGLSPLPFEMRRQADPLTMPGSTNAALAVIRTVSTLRATPITGKALKTALLTASFDPHR